MTIERLNRRRVALLGMLLGAIVAFFAAGCATPAEPEHCEIVPIVWRTEFSATVADSLVICRSN